MQIKLCGLMREQDAIMCAELGADILGFVVEYPVEVPWNLTRDRAKRLIKMTPCATCVVTGGTTEQVLSLASGLMPDMVQLHYQETIEQTADIAEKLGQMGIKTIKAVHNMDEMDRLNQTRIDAILLDSRTHQNASDCGSVLEVDLYRQTCEKTNKPIILAGGITPENVMWILAQTGADRIDVMTGVESAPGIKDKDKVKKLMQNAKNGR